MDIVQTLETTVASRLTREALQFVVVPKRYFVNPGMLGEPDSLIQELGLETREKLNTTSDLIALFSALLAVPTPTLEFRKVGDLVVPSNLMDSARVDLAHRAVEDPLIPFEESPLDFASIASLVSGASGVGIGAYVGFVVSGGTPLAIITVPGGMIIGGAAAGIGAALEKGLRYKILKAMGVPTS
jgi:hypothetical protein